MNEEVANLSLIRRFRARAECPTDTGADQSDVVGVLLGTEIYTLNNLRFRIDGRLVAEGTEYARIRLAPVPGGSSWDGITERIM